MRTDKYDLVLKNKRVPERDTKSLLTPLIKGGKGGFEFSPGFDESSLKQRGLITTGYHLPYNPDLIEPAR